MRANPYPRSIWVNLATRNLSVARFPNRNEDLSRLRVWSSEEVWVLRAVNLWKNFARVEPFDFLLDSHLEFLRDKITAT